MTSLFLPHARLDALIRLLAAQGFAVIGPRVREGVIAYGEISATSDLPWGWHDAQGPGFYRLTRSDARRCFAWANGPQAIKPFLFAPQETLWRAEKNDGCLVFRPVTPAPRPLAFFGVRACDLAALAIQDRVFLGGATVDPYYAARSEELFVISVNCTHPAATCFCASTGDGPQATAGFDISLTELDDGFIAEVGTEAGRDLLAALELAPATAAQQAEAAQALAHAAQVQTRALPGRNLAAALFGRLEHPHWESVAQRCLACGNCTQVCPTCFCHAKEDRPTLDGSGTLHERRWDSCFSAGHAWLHGFQVRPEIRHRYRQWLLHKLAAWHEQFGRSGCVGCGRCISACPVGIDLTQEVAALLAEDCHGG